ncbi:MAG: hypothetical protein ACKERG_03725 [Candidatus Hodgkinia cicadicola]
MGVSGRGGEVRRGEGGAAWGRWEVGRGRRKRGETGPPAVFLLGGAVVEGWKLSWWLFLRKAAGPLGRRRQVESLDAYAYWYICVCGGLQRSNLSWGGRPELSVCGVRLCR